MNFPQMQASGKLLRKGPKMVHSFSMWLSHLGIAHGGFGESTSLSCFIAVKVSRNTANKKTAKKTAQLETLSHNVLKIILPCNTRKWLSGITPRN